jgi:hypothetical protein
MALAALPTGASANTEGEAASPEPIVIAYIPEHLERRIPGFRQSEAAMDGLSSNTEPWLRLELRSSGLQIVPTAPASLASPSEDDTARRRKALGLGIGLGIGIPLIIGAAVGTSMALQSISQIGQ